MEMLFVSGHKQVESLYQVRHVSGLLCDTLTTTHRSVRSYIVHDKQLIKDSDIMVSTSYTSEDKYSPVVSPCGSHKLSAPPRRGRTVCCPRMKFIGVTPFKGNADVVCSETGYQISDSTLLNFVNGRNICIVVIGWRSMIPDLIFAALEKVNVAVSRGIETRQAGIGSTNYECSVEVSAHVDLSHGIREIWTAGSWPINDALTTTKLNELLDAPGFLCIQIRQVHFFREPSVGARENVLTFVVEPRFREGQPWATRDKFVLGRCLSAFKSSLSCVPCKESRLTKFIDIASISEFDVVVGLNVDNRGEKSLIRNLNYIANIITDIK